MSIRKLPNNKWQVRVSHQGKQIGIGTFTRKMDAEAAERDAQSAIQRGTFIPPKIARKRIAEAKAIREEKERLSSITCNEVTEQWLQYLRDHGTKPSTTHKYNSDLNHFRKAFGSTPIAAVTVEDIDNWFEKLSTEPFGKTRRRRQPKTVHNIYTTVERLFTWATGQTKGLPRSFKPLLDSSPCDVPAKRYKATPKKKRDIVATPEQIDAIAELFPAYTRLMVYIAAYNGLRLGEVLALRKRSFARGVNGRLYVEVSSQVSNKNENGQTLCEVTPKSVAGHRQIPVTQVIEGKVQARLDELTNGGDLLFPRKGGGNRFHNPNTIRNQMKRAVDKLNADDENDPPLLEGFVFHGLRHTALTHLGRKGATLADLMAFGGHSDVESVMKYQHAGKERLAMLTSGQG
ncbi:site-specific integrase [Pseudoglutamicibacter cumminsii]|uniref:tyrosine-type recombinase/integrase n=1 Tax=Pseudoglutamicibacter cumminsii TaxID=156979 RepID=UPI002554549F|nr:site-specific integrase [Pseudoglutamicibacter cumminsii]MDK7084087.1 site-specific integrase [Pseudoglutamicibacter cumminsii]